METPLLELMADLHVRNDRQGPGGRDETLRAIELARLEPGRARRIADVGCGTGASALVLAEALGADVVAVDAMPAFVDRLRQRAEDAGLGERVVPRVGDMARLAFEPGSLDVVWSEGAIYNIGFEQGLSAWSRLLRPGGVIAVTELTWTSARRPRAIDEYWKAEYPGIATVPENIRAIERAGYIFMASFFLPRACWEREYYEPLRSGFDAFLDRHGHSREAAAIVEAEAAEMALFKKYGESYGYAFYIARTPDTAPEA